MSPAQDKQSNKVSHDRPGKSAKRSTCKRAFIAIAVGFLATIALNVLAFVADKLGWPFISSVLIWPNTILQSLTPMYNIGTAQRPVMEGTPLNFFAFIVSIPMSWLVYSRITYLVLSTLKGRSG
jgi:hypothetical protein